MDRGDIDIDFANRDDALLGMNFTMASIISETEIKKHNTGVYFHQVPIDPVTSVCSIDYRDAEAAGFFKIDLLNVNLYKDVRDEEHLLKLMNTEPNWENLYDPDFCSKLIHIGNHYSTLIAMPEIVDSIEKMAMLLAVIRPAKKHLIGKTWDEIKKTVWIKSDDGVYGFHKPHAIGYSHLVVVNMNLLEENHD